MLLVYAAWARGGVYPPTQWVLASLSSLLLVGLFYFKSKSANRMILRDPLFSIGLVFLLLLIVQSLNSGYAVMWDRIDQVGMPTLPSKWLPWSVEPNTAAQMVNWFLPAWAAMLVVKHAISEKQLRRVLYFIVWNAALLATVGLLQAALGAEKMLGFWEIPGGTFFATFGYVNHGGAFFYLHAALAAGLAHHAIRKQAHPAQVSVWFLCFILCLAAAFASLSRAAGLAALILTLAALSVVIRGAFKRAAGKSQLINLLGLSCIVALIGLVLYFGAGKGALAQEIGETFWGEHMEQTVAGRTVQLPGAWEIALDYPVFGCGGWGYRWMALLHIPVNEWELWRGAGKANVHCDPLQFLCEFGFVGAFLLAGAVGWLLVQFSRQGKKQAGVSVLSKWIALGLLLIFIHSWVDLPYRCPAILIAWCALLAMLPRLAARSAGWSPSAAQEVAQKT